MEILLFWGVPILRHFRVKLITGGHTVFNKDVSRFVKLGQQCMDRVASIATEQTGNEETGNEETMKLQ